MLGRRFGDGSSALAMALADTNLGQERRRWCPVLTTFTIGDVYGFWRQFVFISSAFTIPIMRMSCITSFLLRRWETAGVKQNVQCLLPTLSSNGRFLSSLLRLVLDWPDKLYRVRQVDYTQQENQHKTLRLNHGDLIVFDRTGLEICSASGCLYASRSFLGLPRAATRMTLRKTKTAVDVGTMTDS